MNAPIDLIPAAPDPNDKDLARKETEARLEKLRLEQQALRRQASWQNQTLEWFKGLTIAATLIGIFLTFFTQTQSIKQAQLAKDVERFDKAIARLASSQATERLSGVSGLRLFLSPDNGVQHKAALLFLVNALATEQDALIQESIFDTFRQVTAGASDEALQVALQSAVEKNRALSTRTKELRAKARHDRAVHLVASALKMEVRSLQGVEIPKRILERLPWEKKIETYPSRESEFLTEVGHERPLKGLSNLIELLVQSGARVTDSLGYSGITCRVCRFVGLKLDNSNFDGADLTAADFSNASLSASTFRNARLAGTMFFNANLIGANLSAERRPWWSKELMDSSPFPLLQCARLTSAILNGQPLMILTKEHYWADNKTVASLVARYPRLDLATMDQTTELSHLTVATLAEYSFKVLKADADARKEIMDGEPRTVVDHKVWASGSVFEQYNAHFASSQHVDRFSRVRVAQVVDLAMTYLTVGQEVAEALAHFIKEQKLSRAKIPTYKVGGPAGIGKEQRSFTEGSRQNVECSQKQPPSPYMLAGRWVYQPGNAGAKMP